MDLARLLAITLYKATPRRGRRRPHPGKQRRERVAAADQNPARRHHDRADRADRCLQPAATCTGRAERTVIVSHDTDGNLSVISCPCSRCRCPARTPATLADPDPAGSRSAEFIHNLADVKPGRICYLTNRRDGVAFDPVIRDLGTGTEQTVELGGRSYDNAGAVTGQALARPVRRLPGAGPLLQR